MQEKRRSKRLPIQLELVVSKLFKQEASATVELNEPIHVVDISKMGIGFESANELPLNYYFNAKLELGSPENSLYCVVKIIRKMDPKEDGTIFYGCEFVGLAPVLGSIFDEYEKSLTEE
jgi:hypothetical protein